MSVRIPTWRHASFRPHYWLAALGVFALFLLPRLANLFRSVVLEDHDSVAYLIHIERWVGLLPPAMINTSPDTTPMYPAIGGALAWLGLEPETAGRTASLLMACVGFAAMLGIAWQYYGPRLALIAGLLMALAFQYAWLDVAVLTEPTYIGLLYLGLFLYLQRYGDSRPVWYALPVGLAFGALFLTRTEGILFIALVPLLHVAATIHTGRWRAQWPRTLAWVAVFVLTFSVLAGPQIATVSEKMGTFAINGREAWMAILQAPGDAGYERRLHGLDYSPAVPNLPYLQANPDALAALERSRSIFAIPMQVGEHLIFTAWKRAIQVAGPALPFVFIGLFVVFRRPRAHPIWLVVVFMLIAAGPAFTHTLAFRHIAFMGPICAITGAVGLLAACRWFAAAPRLPLAWNVRYPQAVAACVAGVLLLNAMPVSARLISPATAMWDYAPADLQQVVQAVDHHQSGGRRPVMIARKGYLPYYSRAEAVMMPFTDYEGLVRYARYNGVDYLYAQQSTDGMYPWVDALEAGVAEFQPVYRGQVAGSRATLYRFIPHPSAVADADAAANHAPDRSPAPTRHADGQTQAMGDNR